MTGCGCGECAELRATAARQRTEISRLVSVNLDTMAREREALRRLGAYARQHGRMRARVADVRDEIEPCARLDHRLTVDDLVRWQRTLRGGDPCAT